MVFRREHLTSLTTSNGPGAFLPTIPCCASAEVWMKTVHVDNGVAVTLISPSGGSLTPTDYAVSPANLHTAGVDGPIVWGIDDTMWRLHVETHHRCGRDSWPRAWRLDDQCLPVFTTTTTITSTSTPMSHAAIRTWACRTGAKRSHFVDPDWEQTRSAAASCTRVNGEFDKSGSLIHRLGTLNGIATAKDADVHVAGGYIILDGRKSTLFVGWPSAPRPALASHRSGLRVALRRVCTLCRAYAPEAPGAAACSA